jgi:tetratricopeptide (TPR) repeat protein
MRRALAGGAGASPAGPLLLASSALLLAAALFFGGGSSLARLAWIGGGAILVAGIAAAAALWGAISMPRPGREGALFLVLIATLVGWTGASVAWSAAPDRSWEYFNRSLVYAAFALLGLFVALDPRAPRRVALGLAVLIAGVAAWALAGKVVPTLYEDYGRFARLRSPVAYWNALALLTAIGLPFALWIASRRAHGVVVRAAGAVLVYALAVALVLTYSRAGLAAAAFAVAVWLVLSRDRFEAVAALLAAAPVTAAVLALALELPGIAEDGQPHDVRVRDGAWFGLAFTLGAGAVFALAYAAARRELSPRRRRLVLRAAAGTAVALLAGAILVVARGDPLCTDVVVGQDPSRFACTSSNSRWSFWEEAWEGFEGEPLLGTGAASFELLHRKLRDSQTIDVTEPHNVALQFLSETGLVGFLLAGGSVAAGLAGASFALRRLKGEQRAAACALAVALPTYVLHAIVDYDWDFVAITGPVFFVTGLLLAAGRPAAVAPRRPLWALAAALVGCAALLSLAAPRLAERQVDEAYAATDPAKGVDAAKAAHSLNPLSIEPLHAWASAEQLRGDDDRALELYVDAVELQPLNADSWYELGRFELEALEDPERARPHLERARELDPFGPAGLVLDSLPAG